MSAFEGKALALGLCVIGWDLAHKWYLKHPENLVPFDEWNKEIGLEKLEKYGLAERKENGIYVKGSRDNCEYLTERVEAGRRGGLKSQWKNSSKLKQIEQNQPSVSSSSSYSSSFSKKIKKSPLTPQGDLEGNVNYINGLVKNTMKGMG